MKSSRFTMLNASGFTLVELMVVIAIVGLLTSIALPQYTLFAARARQAEAKFDLENIYVAETSFQLESGSYTYCLKNIGVSTVGAITYYSFGMAENDMRDCGANGTTSCWNYI